MQTTHSDQEIQVRADFAQASSLIQYRVLGEDEWRPTPYQVADAQHSPENALRLVNNWSDQQS